MHPVRAAITGASGHLGANLVRALVADGHDVAALVRDDARAVAGLPIRVVRGDLFDPRALRAAFEGADVVFHVAARISIGGDRSGEVARTNVGGVRGVVAACLDARVPRLVHVSSIHAFSVRPVGEPVDETRGPSDADAGAPAYDRSKAEGEREVLAGVARGLDAVIVNPTGIIGPHDWKPSRMGRVILDLARGRMPALVDGGFDFVDARDVARATIEAGHRGRRGERYLLPGAWWHIDDLARAVSRIAGVRPPRFVVPMTMARVGAPFVESLWPLAGAEPLYTRESLHALRHYRHVRREKAARDLGYVPRPLEETLADTLAWFRQQGRR
jgi:dihydroflavonol-4-reductase